MKFVLLLLLFSPDLTIRTRQASGAPKPIYHTFNDPIQSNARE